MKMSGHWSYLLAEVSCELVELNVFVFVARYANFCYLWNITEIARAPKYKLKVLLSYMKIVQSYSGWSRDAINARNDGEKNDPLDITPARFYSLQYPMNRVIPLKFITSPQFKKSFCFIFHHSRQWFMNIPPISQE